MEGICNLVIKILTEPSCATLVGEDMAGHHSATTKLVYGDKMLL